MSKSSLLVSSLTLVLAGVGSAACSGGSGSGGGGVDGGINDGDAGAESDAGNGSCATVDDFGDLGAINGRVVSTEDSYLSVDVTLDSTEPADLFIVELYAGSAPFENGIATGTFEITGDQTDYNLCGACVGVFANLPAEEMPEMVYIAQSGTLVVTSIDGDFAGSFTPSGANASFVGYSLDGESFARQDACAITGGGATWNAPIPD